jgi:preprotein translocase subunit SecD
MEKKTLWRVVVIVAVVGLAAWSLYPPEERINLGLDLSGGIHLVLEVQTDDAVKAELDESSQRLVLNAREEQIELVDPEVDLEDIRFTLQIPAGTDLALLEDLAERAAPEYRISKRPETWTFTLPANIVRLVRDQAVRQALETIWNRVDQFGVAEPTIQRQGREGERILVQLPGVDDPERVKGIIASTAFLEFKEVVAGPAPDSTALIAQTSGEMPRGTEILPGDAIDMAGTVVGTEYYLLKKSSIITGRELRSASRSQNEYNQPNVRFSLIPSSVDKFADYTGSHIGTAMAIVLDGRVQSAPVIQSRIPGEGRITGNYTIDEAEDLALKLRAGALPAGIIYLEERTVGPSLGYDSVVRGVRSALTGLIVVMLFMLVYYKFSGLNANLALVLNILILLGVMAYFGATLTLPGIAGVILTIGMAVDANVLIFERVREELRVGKTVRSAIDTGFSRAFGTILDANLTTLVAALFLFRFGTGPIKGFAVTLSIGIVASMFTAVFVSRTIYMLVLQSRDRVQTLSI